MWMYIHRVTFRRQAACAAHKAQTCLDWDTSNNAGFGFLRLSCWQRCSPCLRHGSTPLALSLLRRQRLGAPTSLSSWSAHVNGFVVSFFRLVFKKNRGLGRLLCGHHSGPSHNGWVRCNRHRSEFRGRATDD